jgi:hypothetical protein
MDAARNVTHTLATGNLYYQPIILAWKSVCDCGVQKEGNSDDGPEMMMITRQNNTSSHACTPDSLHILHVRGRPAFGSRSEEK